MSEIVSDNDREERERELNNKKRESYYMLLSLVVRMREHAHYIATDNNNMQSILMGNMETRLLRCVVSPPIIITCKVY